MSISFTLDVSAVSLSGMSHKVFYRVILRSPCLEVPCVCTHTHTHTQVLTALRQPVNIALVACQTVESCSRQAAV